MKFAFTRYGLKDDPTGAHVTLTLRGRTLLGEVTGCTYDHVTGCARLRVRHFNGEPWPIEPRALAVDVLERDYPANG